MYVGRREWRRAAIAVGLTCILVAPMLLYDLSAYTTDPGTHVLAWGTPLFWPLVTGAVAAALASARSSFGWLGAGTAAVLALPKWWMYDLTFLLVGLARTHQPRDARER